MFLHCFPQDVATHTPPATPVTSAALCPCSTSLTRFPNVAKLLGQGIASAWGWPHLCEFFLTPLGRCLFLVYARSIGCTVLPCLLARGCRVSATETFWLSSAQPVFSPHHAGPRDDGGGGATSQRSQCIFDFVTVTILSCSFGGYSRHQLNRAKEREATCIRQVLKWVQAAARV